MFRISKPLFSHGSGATVEAEEASGNGMGYAHSKAVAYWRASAASPDRTAIADSGGGSVQEEGPDMARSRYRAHESILGNPA